MCKWHELIFKINSPNIQNPKVWIDIFIIDKIIRDVLTTEKSKIILWRIHRRWLDDREGHQLTLSCFTKEQTANSIEKLIKESESFKILQANSLLAEDLKKVTGRANIRDIADDSSTHNWPEELKDSWPFYIGGCSKMFLCLIDSLKDKAKSGVDGKDISEIENFYTGINNRLIEIWQEHGSHAFFHHINAIFGYVPTLAKPRGFHGILASF